MVGLALLPVLSWGAIFFLQGFGTIGGDTYYHIKYAQAIISAGKVVSYDPYFPTDPLGYTLGSHIVVANLSILSGISVIPIVTVTPLLFGIPIVFVFYSFASRYLQRRYAFLATWFFYGASLIPVPESSVNGAVISNSIAYPYTSVQMGMYLFYTLLLLLALARTSLIQNILTGIVLGELTLTFHLLALAAGLVMVAYTVALRSRNAIMNTAVIFASGVALSSFYWVHILATGLPSQTSAFGTYVQLTAGQYLETLGAPIASLLFVGVLILVMRRQRISLKLIEEKYLLLLTLALSLVVASQAWRIGLVLVNDLFLFFDIGPFAVLGAIVLALIVREIERKDQKILGTAIISLLVLVGPIMALNSVGPTLGGPNANIEVPNYGVIDWMNVHASGAVFASDMGSQFLIASEANVIPIAIPPAIADYYVSDLGARLQGLKAIFGDSIQASAAALLQYNVSYIISTYSQPSDSITGSPYVTPVYPVQPCFSGGGTRYDFEATGVPQIFDLYSGNTTNYYLLSNLGRELSLTITYLFNPRTSGLVEIYVNNTLVKTLTGISRGIWITSTIQIPSSLVSQLELVKIVNMDPANEWYLQTISMGAGSQCPFSPSMIPRETIFLVNRTALHGFMPVSPLDLPIPGNHPHNYLTNLYLSTGIRQIRGTPNSKLTNLIEFLDEVLGVLSRQIFHLNYLYRRSYECHYYVSGIDST